MNKYGSEQVKAEYESVILCYMQPANMTLQQYVDDLFHRSSTVNGVYAERSLNAYCIECVNKFIVFRLQFHCRQNPQVDLT